MDRVALAGVDWGKSENAFVVRGKDGAVWRDRFPQTPQGVHLWAAALRARYPEGKVAVALEQSRGALIYALSTYDFIELLTVHPSQTAAYRGVARPSGAKSDPIDADLIYDFVEKHSEKVRTLPAVDALTRELTLLVEWHARAVLSAGPGADGRAQLADVARFHPAVVDAREAAAKPAGDDPELLHQS